MRTETTEQEKAANNQTEQQSGEASKAETCNLSFCQRCGFPHAVQFCPRCGQRLCLSCGDS